MAVLGAEGGHPDILAVTKGAPGKACALELPGFTPLLLPARAEQCPHSFVPPREASLM